MFPVRRFHRLLAVALSFSIISCSCSGYKEIIKSEKCMRSAGAIYLCFEKQYYKLSQVTDNERYYFADASPVTIPSHENKDVIIFSYDMLVLEQSPNLLSIAIDKTQIYKYTRIVHNKDRAMIIISSTLIATVIILAISSMISNSLDDMSVF